MTDQELREFAQSLAHEYVRVRQEWYDAISQVQETRWNRDKEIWHYVIAIERKDKTQAIWDQMFRVCDKLLPTEVKKAFNVALTQIERGQRL